MGTWEDKDRWHSNVHHHLGENLLYYLVNVKTPDYVEIKKEFDTFLGKHQLGSIRVFSIFGMYDLIIRAWLHPIIINRFREYIKEKFGREPLPFAVTKILLMSQNNGENNTTMDLNKLTPELISSIQEGKDLFQKENFIKNGLIIEKINHPDLIRFYVSVQIPPSHKNIEDSVASRITEHLMKLNSTDGFIKYTSIYQGFGFGSFLMNCQVNYSDYFRITEIPDWINSNFKEYDISTETFLVHSFQQLAGNEKIGKGTFIAIRGHDPFILSILPEAYDEEFYENDRTEKIIKILKENEQSIKSLREEDQLLVHNVSSAYLFDDYTKLSGILFIFFTQLESDLAKNIEHYAIKYSIDFKKYFNNETKKNYSLGELLVTYNKIFQELSKPTLILKNHQKLSEIRNYIAHQLIDLDNDLGMILKEIIEKMPMINKVREEIKKVTVK